MALGASMDFRIRVLLRRSEIGGAVIRRNLGQHDVSFRNLLPASDSRVNRASIFERFEFLLRVDAAHDGSCPFRDGDRERQGGVPKYLRKTLRPAAARW